MWTFSPLNKLYSNEKNCKILNHHSRSQQGFGAQQAQTGLLSRGALAEMQGLNAPTATQNMITGALGGIMGMF